MLYTDGITEAMDGAQRQFTLERLQQVQGAAQLDCSALVARVMKEVEQFCGDAPQSDDKTMLVLAYHGEGGTQRHLLSEKLHRDPVELTRIFAAWNELEKAQGFDQHLAFRVRLGLEELLTNIINHGGEEGGSGDIGVTIDTDGKDVIVEIRDGGPPFNPLEVPPPDTSQSLEDREPGGLGIHLLRNIFDHFSYRRENGNNVVVLQAAISSLSDT